MIERNHDSLDFQLPQDEFYARAYKAPAEVKKNGLSPALDIGMGIAISLALFTGIDTIAKLHDSDLSKNSFYIGCATAAIIGIFAGLCNYAIEKETICGEQIQ